MAPRARDRLAAAVGVVAAIVAFAVSEAASLPLGGAGNPIIAVGSLIIDLVPPGFKTLVIDLFDTADKLVLFLCLGVLLLILAVVAGVLQSRRPPFGLVVICVIAAVALLAVVTRAESTPTAAIPTIAGAIGGILTLRRLTSRLTAWSAASAHPTEVAGDTLERRSFLRITIATAVTGAVVGTFARIASAGAAAVNDVRRTLGLPAPVSAVDPIPDAGRIDDLQGISPWVTPNADFYRIDTALQVPSIDPADWSLSITGMVENEITIDFAELLALPMIERYVTLACVSQDVGGDLIGNALWLGHPIRELLARAVPTEGADMVLSTSIDGFTASTPLSVLQDEERDSILAVGMNGDPLPLEHGFPVRMVVPGLYGFVSATKWVVSLKVTRFEDDLAYWSTRGWSERGPIKLSSRIDTANPDPNGSVVVGGVAWAQHVGIAKVEVRVDDGRWMEADLTQTVTVDSWLQWSARLAAAPGSHEVTVRATDADGREQVAEYDTPPPDGSTGLHSMTVQFG